MIDSLKPYPEYRDSGLPWLGQIPKHWDVRRFKYLLREINAHSAEGQEQLLRVSQYTGVTKRLSRNGDDEPDTRAASLVGYKQVVPNDIVVNIMLAWNGSLGVSRYSGVVSPAYCVYRFNVNTEPWYYHHLLRLPLYKGRVKVSSTGVVESRLRLYSDDLFRIEALLPRAEEQKAIVRFVAVFERQIDFLIRNKMRLIKLLNEQKQVIIHRAVTRGINPNIRLQPSGIEWLGDVPEHWDVKRATSIFRERNERGRENLPILVVSLNTGVTVGGELDEDGRPRRLIEDRKSYKLAIKNDIAYNMMRMWQGAVGVVPVDGLVSPAYVVAKSLPKINSRYYVFVFRTDTCKGEINANSHGIVSDRNRLYWDDFKNLSLPVPDEEEQGQIVDHIDSETKSLDQAIDSAKREISLLREYRTRLIADVVTGKLDVRGVELTALEAGDASEEMAFEEVVESEETVADVMEGADA